MAKEAMLRVTPGDPVLVRQHDFDSWVLATFIGFDTNSGQRRVIVKVFDHREVLYSQCRLLATEKVI
jgi:hypothetical protein